MLCSELLLAIVFATTQQDNVRMSYFHKILYNNKNCVYSYLLKYSLFRPIHFLQWRALQGHYYSYACYKYFYLKRFGIIIRYKNFSPFGSPEFGYGSGK